MHTIMTRFRNDIVWGMLAFVLFCPRTPLAQTTGEVNELRQEIQALQEGQKKIQEKLEELMKLASPRPQQEQFQEAEISLESVPVLGKKDAPVTVVEFTDYQCPFCAQHFRSSLPQIEEEYLETGKLRYAAKQFPLRSIHPAAQKAAEAALCAGDQGKYWEMHKHLFTNQRALAPKNLMEYASVLGLNADNFRRCLDGSKYFQRVEDELAGGTKAGVRGTPTLFLGLTDPSDESKVLATVMLRGAQPYANIKDAIEKLLKEKPGADAP